MVLNQIRVIVVVIMGKEVKNNGITYKFFRNPEDEKAREALKEVANGFEISDEVKKITDNINKVAIGKRCEIGGIIYV